MRARDVGGGGAKLDWHGHGGQVLFAHGAKHATRPGAHLFLATRAFMQPSTGGSLGGFVGGEGSSCPQLLPTAFASVENGTHSRRVGLH